jgi:gluconate 2-dehydrogenase gamma chain
MLTRRDVLRNAAAAGSAAVISWLRPRNAFANEDSLVPVPVTPGRYAYFTAPEIAFLDAAASRLIPSDDLGPGAKEAGATFFIDQQMAGPFGRAETWYMQGPWKDGTEQQGYQLKLNPAQLYRLGIRATDDHCRRSFGNKSFAELGAQDQDKVLHGLEKGDI